MPPPPCLPAALHTAPPQRDSRSTYSSIARLPPPNPLCAPMAPPARQGKGESQHNTYPYVYTCAIYLMYNLEMSPPCLGFTSGAYHLPAPESCGFSCLPAQYNKYGPYANTKPCSARIRPHAAMVYSTHTGGICSAFQPDQANHAPSSLSERARQ